VGPRACLDGGKHKNLFPSSGTEPRYPSCPVHIPVTSLTRYPFMRTQTNTSARISGARTPGGYSTPSHIYITALLISRDTFTTRLWPQTVTFVLIKHFTLRFSSAAGSNIIGVTCSADHLSRPSTQHVDRCTRVEMAVREWLPMHEHDLYNRRN